MNQATRFDAAVVGAGPAGLMAALAAARAGSSVLVLEQRPEAGTRLLSTGGGHCNFTNTLEPADFIRRFGAKSRFVTPALRAMPPARLRAFFDDLGVSSHSPDGLHVLPADGSARTVRDALLRACHAARVTFRFGSVVERLRAGEGACLELDVAGRTVTAGRVILAAGGASYPGLGGGESGYRLAAMTGHSVVPPCPALVPLISREPWPGTLAGITLPRVTVGMLTDGVATAAGARETGSLLFTHRGITGPVALDISGRVARALMSADCVPVALDLAPDLTADGWARELEEARRDHGAKAVLTWLRFRLPAALAEVVLDQAGLDASVRVSQLSRATGTALFERVKSLPLTITATEGFGKAMAAQGGVPVDEVDARTMQSRRARGLFLAGEVLDVDGPCGGFNLQWAFSSGYVAGGGR